MSSDDDSGLIEINCENCGTEVKLMMLQTGAIVAACSHTWCHLRDVEEMGEWA